MADDDNYDVWTFDNDSYVSGSTEIKTDSSSGNIGIDVNNGNKVKIQPSFSFFEEDDIDQEAVEEQYEKVEKIREKMIEVLGRESHNTQEIDEWKRDFEKVKGHLDDRKDNIFIGPNKPIPPDELEELNDIYRKWVL